MFARERGAPPVHCPLKPSACDAGDVSSGGPPLLSLPAGLNDAACAGSPPPSQPAPPLHRRTWCDSCCCTLPQRRSGAATAAGHLPIRTQTRARRGPGTVRARMPAPGTHVVPKAIAFNPETQDRGSLPIRLYVIQPSQSSCLSPAWRPAPSESVSSSWSSVLACGSKLNVHVRHAVLAAALNNPSVPLHSSAQRDLVCDSRHQLQRRMLVQDSIVCRAGVSRIR